jgi:His/Glu/Gln/Arg/opine family amino acid ABC transporter permease subunit
MSLFDILANILVGINVTIKVTLYGMLYAVPFAFVFGVAQHFTKGIIRLFVTSIIEFWRSSPVIILIYGFYFSLPGLGVQLSAMTVGAMVLGLNIGGYGSQAVRAALQALDPGQVEAGYALGFRRQGNLARLPCNPGRHDLSCESPVSNPLWPRQNLYCASDRLFFDMLSSNHHWTHDRAPGKPWPRGCP